MSPIGVNSRWPLAHGAVGLVGCSVGAPSASTHSGLVRRATKRGRELAKICCLRAIEKELSTTNSTSSLLLVACGPIAGAPAAALPVPALECEPPLAELPAQPALLPGPLPPEA